MSDYRLTIKVSNGRIAKLMEARGLKRPMDLARAAGLEQQYSRLAALLALKLSPKINDGQDWRPIVLKLADFFQVMPDDMFSPRQMRAMPKTVAIMDMSEGQIVAAVGRDDPTVLEDMAARDFVAKALTVLTEREAAVLTARFGLGDDKDHTFRECSTKFGIHQERVRQIEQRALHKIRKKMGKKYPT